MLVDAVGYAGEALPRHVLKVWGEAHPVRPGERVGAHPRAQPHRRVAHVLGRPLARPRLAMLTTAVPSMSTMEAPRRAERRSTGSTSNTSTLSFPGASQPRTTFASWNRHPGERAARTTAGRPASVFPAQSDPTNRTAPSAPSPASIPSTSSSGPSAMADGMDLSANRLSRGVSLSGSTMPKGGGRGMPSRGGEAHHASAGGAGRFIRWRCSASPPPWEPGRPRPGRAESHVRAHAPCSPTTWTGPYGPAR